MNPSRHLPAQAHLSQDTGAEQQTCSDEDDDAGGEAEPVGDGLGAAQRDVSHEARLRVGPGHLLDLATGIDDRRVADGGGLDDAATVDHRLDAALSQLLGGLAGVEEGGVVRRDDDGLPALLDAGAQGIVVGDLEADPPSRR